MAALCLAGAATSPIAAALKHEPVRVVAAPCNAHGVLAEAICREAGVSRDPDSISAFYSAHGAAPLWVGPNGLNAQGKAAVAVLRGAAGDGLDPGAYLTPDLEAALDSAREGDAGALARAEVALSEAVGAWASDLHNPHADRLAFVDPGLDLRPLTRRGALEAAAAKGVVELERMNPVYEALRARLADYRAGRLAAPGGRPDFERLILLNLERARTIPADPGPRFILVDAAGQRLQLYENGRVTHEMEVAVGKPSEPTPEMAGLIRFLVFNPYWNVPPDLVRNGLARKVLAHGPAALAAQHMQALADWSPDAQVLDPGDVDWPAVASGAQILRVRQLPGAGNMMGRVKFMLPNPLGVYLHDTPRKSVFQAAQRNVSAGCVRLAHALSLAEWLRPGAAPPATADSETRVDLDRPVPVYILYFTVAPSADGLSVRRDVYGRDRRLPMA